MSLRKPRTLIIRDARQLRAIRTPLRQELLQTLIHMGSASVKMLAEALGKSPASLYYHVHELESAGLILKAVARGGEQKSEARYEPVAKRISIERTEGSKDFMEALNDLHRAALSQAEREISAALAREGSDSTSPSESVMLVRLSARLSRGDAKKARGMLNELAAFMSEHDDPGGSETLALTGALVDVP